MYQELYPGASIVQNPAYDNQDTGTPGSVDTMTYGYDPDQNVIQAQDGRGVVTAYQRIDPESLVTEIDYSNLPSTVTAINSVNYAYDGYGRRMSMDDTSGGQSVYGTTKVYAYDDLDETESVTTSFLGGPQNLVINYRHNNDGSRSAMSAPLAPISSASYTYAYDNNHRLTGITAPFYDNINKSRSIQHPITYAYQANNWLMSMSQGVSGTGVVESTSYSYDARGFLTGLANMNNSMNNSTMLSQFTINGGTGTMPYDAAGNRLGFVETLAGVQSGQNGTTRTVTYGYDSRDELTGEDSTIGNTYGSILNANYDYGNTYDNAYNPTTWKNTQSEFGFDSDDQITSAMSLTSPMYDGSGNPTTFSTYATTQTGPSDPTNVPTNDATFSFDPEQRLTGISSSSPAITFTAHYDGDGMRDVKTAVNAQGQSVTTYYLYDGGALLEEMTASGSTPALQEMYLTGVDGLRARWDPANGDLETDVYAYDPEGSLTEFQVTEATNPTQRTLVYDGWGYLTGNILYVQGTEQIPIQPSGFGGQYGYYTDQETGLCLLGARYYDAGKGRFVNRDPIGYNGGQNLYAFCGNNPINEEDEDGDYGQRNHFLTFSSRKQALEAAQRKSAKGQKPIEHVFDYTHPEAPPHFHAVDANGEKRGDGVHYGYPRRGGQLPSARLTARADRKLTTKIVGAEEAQKVLDKAGPNASKLRIRKLANEAAEGMKGKLKDVPVVDILFVFEDFFVNNRDHSANGLVNSLVNGTSPLDQVYIPQGPPPT